jgi:glucose-6-phosphate 1-dehydrogenase
MPHTIVIFGASGDLTARKLIPAIYRLFSRKRLPPDTRVVGVSRTDHSHQSWRDELTESTGKFLADDFDLPTWLRFASELYYLRGDIQTRDDFQRLEQLLAEIERGATTTRVYYLSTLPSLLVDWPSRRRESGALLLRSRSAPIYVRLRH